MQVITQLSVKKTSGLGYTCKATIAVVENYCEANRHKVKITVNMSMKDLFNNLCSGECCFSKQCNKGFWFLNAQMIEKDAISKGINIESVKEYHKYNVALYYEVFGELYNNFIERYDRFTANGRQVVTIVE